MDKQPKVSIVVPFHWMKHWWFFLLRVLRSIEQQTFTDYEVILTLAGSMPVNTNRAIQSAKGEIIKILYMDDYFGSEMALEKIVEGFKGGWLATGCLHDSCDIAKQFVGLFNPHLAKFDGIKDGINSIGSPSVIAFENKDPLLFDENMTWLLDVDYYQRLYERYGAPTILDDYHTIIGVGEHQMTNILTDEQKLKEQIYFNQKYD